MPAAFVKRFSMPALAMTTDQQIATLRNIRELRRELQILKQMLLGVIALQLINLVVSITRL